MHKDMSLALDLANQLGVPLPSAAATREVLSSVKGAAKEDVDFSALASFWSKSLSVELRDYGLAPGGRKHIGRSREVAQAAGASRIAGMQFTTTAAVAMSPWVPPGIVSVKWGLPVISAVSRIFRANKHLQFQCKFFPSRRINRARSGAHRLPVPRDLKILGLHVFACDDGLDRFRNFVHAQA